MELTAVIKGLSVLTRRCTVAIYTDSEYVRNGIMTWIHGWKRRGWKTADGKPVKNVELWQQLETLANAHDVQVALGARATPAIRATSARTCWPTRACSWCWTARRG